MDVPTACTGGVVATAVDRPIVSHYVRLAEGSILSGLHNKYTGLWVNVGRPSGGLDFGEGGASERARKILSERGE